MTDPPAGDKGTKALNGYTLGLGVDYKFTDNFFARAEYRFNDFGSVRVVGQITNYHQACAFPDPMGSLD